jgi:hypothetical protein
MIRLCFGLLIWFLLLACQRQSHSPEKLVHVRLLGFKADFLAEEMDETYEKLHLAKKLQQHHIEVIPVRDVLYVSLIRAVNACGRYRGNIAFSHDTIYLHYDFVSDTMCASGRVDKLTYLIDNPGLKKYKMFSSD